MGHGRDFSNMNRRAARMLLLPLVLLFLMTPKVRSQSRSGKSRKAAASKSATKQSASQASPSSQSSSEDAGKGVESTLKAMSVEANVGQLLLTTYHRSLTATDPAAYTQMLQDVEALHVGRFLNVTQGSP